MREQAKKHKKRKSHKLGILLWTIIFALIFVGVMCLFAYFGYESIGDIWGERTFWLINGVVDGMIMVAYLLMYRVDAQDIAMNENDLEDTEWLTVKKLKKMKEFTVTNFDKVNNKPDGIVIGAEKKGKEIEIISTDSYGNPTSNTVLICRLYNITDALLTARVGDTVKIKYEREGVENTASIVLMEECINEIK